MAYLLDTHTLLGYTPNAPAWSQVASGTISKPEAYARSYDHVITSADEQFDAYVVQRIG
jgi:hypothetical protein